MSWLRQNSWSSTPQRIRLPRRREQCWTPSSTRTGEVDGTYDAAVVDKENGKAHVVKRMDHPHVRIIPEWFGGGALTRKELNDAAEELLADEAGLIVIGEATIEPALDKVFTGTAKVFKREVAATVDQITSELQQAFKG
jgi:hypothetical protein